jgi:poly-gamma-glutamate capsule biosynthesis protein CapA/YwtB (metallophosphatase superfamily)
LKNRPKPNIPAIGFFISSVLIFLCLMSACNSPKEVKPLDNNEFWGSGYKILLGGDFSYGDTYERGKEINNNYGYDYPLIKVAPFLDAADYSIINLETPITGAGIEPYKNSKRWIHRGEPSVYPRYMKKYRINAVSLANNHTMDCGSAGLLDTLKILDGNSISRVGAGSNADDAAKPLIKDIAVGQRHIKLAIFAASEDGRRINSEELSPVFASGAKPGLNRLEPEKIAKGIKAFKENNPGGFVVVFPHWGSNYAWKSKSQDGLAQKLADAGADIVIGHGSHLIQEIVKKNDKWVIYSLGNFVFNSPGRYKKRNAWPYSAVLILRFSSENGKLKAGFRLYPVVTDNLVTNYQTHPVDKKDFQRTIELLTDRSEKSGAMLPKMGKGRDKLGFFLEGIVF